MILTIARQSLTSRKLASVLTIIAISASVALMLAIDRIKHSTRESFAATVAGVDLIVGARTNPVNLLLSSVFHIGNINHSLSMATFQQLADYPEVTSAIPLSMGDSYRGYRVIGTDASYFQEGSYDQLAFASGRKFADTFEVVLGYQVARQHRLGDKIVLAHGTGDVTFTAHDDLPFTVVGMLAATGTPTDRSLLIPLAAVSALHQEDEHGEHDEHDEHGEHNEHSDHGKREEHDEHHRPETHEEGHETHEEKHEDHEEKHEDHEEEHETHDESPQLSAVMLKVKDRVTVLDLQHRINGYQHEPLTALIPAVGLRELWKTLALAEQSFIVVSYLVLVIALLGMTVALLTTLSERRREMAILRAIGASARTIFVLLISEALLLSICGIIGGLAILYAGLLAFSPLLAKEFALTVGLLAINGREPLFLLAIIGCALLAGLIPAYRAYKNSLADGLTIRV